MSSLGGGGPAPSRGSRRTAAGFRSKAWLVGAAVVVLVGCSASVVAASMVGLANGRQSRQAFGSTSAQIASALEVVLQHEQQLSLGAGAFVIGNPHATQAEFLQWTDAIHAFTQYPELLDIAEVTLVPAAQLPAFAAQEVADPSGPLSADGSFQPSPAGIRPYYCFATVSQYRGSDVSYPAGIDYCQSALGPALLVTRDSGRSAYLPFGSGPVPTLAVGTAIYRGGVDPPTVAARRAALIGWTGTQIRSGVVLDAALRGHPGMALAFRYGQGAHAVTLRAGTAPAGAESTTVDLHNGWRVEVSGTVTPGRLLANRDSLALLSAGLVLSLLLGLLVFVLGTGRARAVDLVRQRTEQLRFQAFHDPLTGLANRTLILDRAGQMLARSRRDRTQVAVLFLDLDNFKAVNDTLGHRAGDQLLEAVGSRLEGSLRAGDTVGRLGGDEFVVLVDGPTLASGVGVVAHRMLALFDTPFDIAASDVPYPVTASIGIAEDDGGSADDLLRDADVALRRAKEAGKERALVFNSSMQLAVEERRTLERDLRTALQDDQFFLQYQPVFDLTSGVVTGVEALLRWRHPDRGVVQPDDFIPVLEANGQIIPVGRWVLETACRQGARWLGQGYRIDLSVNLSGRQVEREQLVDEVRRRSGRQRAGPGRVDPRADRDQPDARRGDDRGPTRLAEGAGAPGGHRRFRHGLLVHLLPPAVPRRHPQDRPVVRVPDRRDTGLGRPGPHAGPAGQGARTGHRGRGDRDRGAAGAAPRRTGRLRAGLPHVASGRRVGGGPPAGHLRRAQRSHSRLAAGSAGRGGPAGGPGAGASGWWGQVTSVTVPPVTANATSRPLSTPRTRASYRPPGSDPNTPAYLAVARMSRRRTAVWVPSQGRSTFRISISEPSSVPGGDDQGPPVTADVEDDAGRAARAGHGLGTLGWRLVTGPAQAPTRKPELGTPR